MEKKVMIVSGGASGLGLAAAIKFAKNDFNVVIIDIVFILVQVYFMCCCY
jgi:NAD(P)-dependent dehydrogenase (short-subunit alcohol dehydrogenase family)